MLRMKSSVCLAVAGAVVAVVAASQAAAAPAASNAGPEVARGRFFSPADADRALDVKRGYVGAEAARRDYGVVLADGVVDAAATEALRATMARHEGHFDLGPERRAFEASFDALVDYGVKSAVEPIRVIERTTLVPRFRIIAKWAADTLEKSN